MSKHEDGWIQTYTGVRFDLFDPQPEMVDIRDIAHALSNVCRFAGHTRRLYSVAQHSVIVSRNVPEEDALVALLHDATEAYVGDVVRPLKRQLPDYVEVEARIWEVIRQRFGLGALTPAVKLADERALQTERRDVLNPSAHRWSTDDHRAAPFRDIIKPLWPPAAERLFLQRFTDLACWPAGVPQEVAHAAG